MKYADVVRLDCEFDNENVLTSNSTTSMGGAVTSPGSVAGGDQVPTSQRMDRFELR